MNQINNSKKIYHAAIYVRLSKEDGDVATAGKRESNSISNQKDLIKNFLKDKKDIVVVSERVDDGYSGSNFERPAFQMMLEDIKKGIVDCVVVKDLSRFGREYIDAGKYIERLFPALGVRFIAVNDHYDSLEGKSQAEIIWKWGIIWKKSCRFLVFELSQLTMVLTVSIPLVLLEE